MRLLSVLLVASLTLPLAACREESRVRRIDVSGEDETTAGGTAPSSESAAASGEATESTEAEESPAQP